MSFDALGLAPELLRAVADEGYTEPTPVQREAIPLVLERRDLLAGAQTGTGKTAAFVLPIIQILHATRVGPAVPEPALAAGPRACPATARPVRVLVVVPTRELAIQVEESDPDLRQAHARSARPRSTAASASSPRLAKRPRRPRDRRRHARPPARPREQRTIDLSRVEILVLDEADRMLDMGFIRDIRKIIDAAADAAAAEPALLGDLLGRRPRPRRRPAPRSRPRPGRAAQHDRRDSTRS